MPENVFSAGYFMPYSARSLESKNRGGYVFLYTISVSLTRCITFRPMLCPASPV